MKHINIKKMRSQYLSSGKLTHIPLSHRLNAFMISVSFALKILLRKPCVFFKILINTLIGKKLKIKSRLFRTVTLAVDYKCNFSCEHCNVSLMTRDNDSKMSISDYQKMDRDLDKVGVLSYAFTGGEPLIFKGLFDLIKVLRPQKKLFLVQTNAAELTQQMANRLYQAGVDILCVSIDKMHSQQINDASAIDFQWYDSILDIAKKAGLKVQLLYVVDNENLDDGEFEEVINYCFSKKTLLLYNTPIPLGNWNNNYDKLISKENSAFLRFFEKNTPYARTDHKSNINGYGCPAFKEKLYITPYGDVQGCTFLQFSLGNLKNESVATILDRVKELPYFHKYVGLCPPAEDRDYIEKYFRTLNKSGNYPLGLDEYLKDCGNKR